MKRHLVRYVDNCSPITKTFTSKNKFNDFLKKLEKEYLGKQMDGYWIDLVCYDIEGDIIDDGELI